MPKTNHKLDANSTLSVPPVNHVIGADAGHAPVPSPARALQDALRSGYSPAGYRNRRLSVLMLILSLVAVYTLAALAAGTPVTA